MREKNNEINRVWDRDRMTDRQTQREGDWGTAWHRKRKRKREMWEAHEENEGKTVEDRETLKLLTNWTSLSFARESHNLYLDDTMNLFISLHHWIDWFKALFCSFNFCCLIFFVFLLLVWFNVFFTFRVYICLDYV